MKNIHELLREKEMDRARVQKEIDALRLTIPLLEDDGLREETLPDTEVRKQPEPVLETAPAGDSTGTDGPNFSSLRDTGFWKRRR